MISALEQELLRNSPTFRNQVSAAFTTVAMERWKAARLTIATINALGENATVEQALAKEMAMTERAFLEQALNTQGVNITGSMQPIAAPGSGLEQAAKEGITRMINQMLTSTWAWTVQEWLDGQATAITEIQTRLNEMFAAIVALPQE